MRKFLRCLFLCNFIITCLMGAAQNAEWMSTSSVISFKIRNAGFNVSGMFSGLKSKIIFDETKTSGNLISASIDVKTIDTGNSTRDGHLKKEEYFDVEKFPIITLSSQNFLKQNNGTYKGLFKLTIKNLTKDVSIPFSFSEKDGKGVFKGALTINRLDFDVGSSSMLMSDDVTINIAVYVIKK